MSLTSLYLHTLHIIGSYVLVHDNGDLHNAKFKFQSAIVPAYGYVVWKNRTDNKHFMVPIVNIHDPATHNIGKRKRKMTDRFADTIHSTGVQSTIDYNARPNYEEMVDEPEITRNQYDELMKALDNQHKKNSTARKLNSLPELQITSDQVKNQDQCGICIDFFKEGEIWKEIICGHLFHYKCLYSWLVTMSGSNCPMCRQSVT